MVDTAVTPVAATTLAGSAAAPDMSMIGLFLHADPIVQAIMLAMIAMSIASWAIIIEKWVMFNGLKSKTERFEYEFWSADALDQFYTKVKKRKVLHPMTAVFSAAMEEWSRSKKPGRGNDLSPEAKARMLQMMAISRNKELDKIEGGLGFLGSAGSSAPFIGLFGTVIGIMNSFTSIAGANNTSLAVVAPGIAEALFATAIGLFVAIPAVLAYNRFSQQLARFAGRLEDFSAEFSALISRQTGA